MIAYGWATATELAALTGILLSIKASLGYGRMGAKHLGVNLTEN